MYSIGGAIHCQDHSGSHDLPAPSCNFAGDHGNGGFYQETQNTVLAVVTAVILMAGGIRVHADEGKVLADEGKSVRVSTAKQLKAALENDFR